MFDQSFLAPFGKPRIVFVSSQQASSLLLVQKIQKAKNSMVGTADRLVAGRKRAQISSVLLAALGGFILTSLATHSNFDAPNSSQIRMESFNWGGQIGAHLSYALLTTVGYAGYVIPAL